jgi:hypothetical protein
MNAMTMNKSGESLRPKSPPDSESSAPPELFDVLDALGAAAEICENPCIGNGLAKRIESLCTGETLAEVRRMAFEFRNTKALDVRADLAARIYTELDSVTAGYAVESGPVMAGGAI